MTSIYQYYPIFHEEFISVVIYISSEKLLTGEEFFSLDGFLGLAFDRNRLTTR